MTRETKMTTTTITATNARQLVQQIDATGIPFNFGREGARRTWFVNGAWGANVRTGLSFSDVVDAAQQAVDDAGPTD